MPKQTISGNQAREALQRGVDAVADPVKVTLGPRGRNVLIDRPLQPLATRDGVTVAKECSNLADPYENMGALLAREVADAAVTEAGDGTTTATVIFQAITRGGLKLVSAGAEPLAIADGIMAAAEACAETIKSMAIEATPQLVEQVAFISTHGDRELSSLVAEAALKVGQSGVIELAESRTHETTVEYVEGFYFERGLRGPTGINTVFVNDPSGQRCVLDNPLILISERGIFNGTGGVRGDSLWNIQEACVKARRPLLIIADELAGDAFNLFAVNIARGILPGGCFVKLPGFGDQRAQALEDLRIAVGAKRIHSQTSTKENDQLSSFTIDDLGTCVKAIVGPARTVLVEGNANTELLPKRIGQLKKQASESMNPLEKSQIDHRIARLSGGVAILRVGGHSEPAMLERKARAEDAIHACRGAMESGVVPGGGTALLRAAKAYDFDASLDSFSAGILLLIESMEEPARQIMRNCGKNPETVDSLIHGLKNHLNPTLGYNSANGRVVDLYDAGIVDPAKVVLVALRKAASIGALLLTTEVLVTDVPSQSVVFPMPMPEGMR